MRVILLSIALSILLISCLNEPKISEKYTDDEIALLFKDIYLAKAAASEVRKPVQDSVLNVYLEQISNFHNITPEEFQQIEIELSHDIKRLERIMIIVEKDFDAMNKLDDRGLE